MRTCITQGTGGKIWANSRLSSPYNPSVGTFDRFTGGWTVRLQGCSSPFSATTLETATEAWDGQDHARYSLSPDGIVSGVEDFYSPCMTI